MKSIIIYSDFDGCPSVFNENAKMEELVTPIYYLNTKADMEYIEMLRILINRGYDVRFASKVLSDDITEAKKQFLAQRGIQVPFIGIPYDKDKANYIEEAEINILAVQKRLNGLKTH